MMTWGSETIEERTARITSTMLGYEEYHGVLTSMITMEWSGGGQGFGGYALGGPFTDWYIRGVLKAAGVKQWEDLKGQHVRIRHGHSMLYAIGNINNDPLADRIVGEWFRPADWKEGNADAAKP
jgi:hypothetical protein